MFIQRTKDREIKEENLKKGWVFKRMSNERECVYCNICSTYVERGLYSNGCYCQLLSKK